MYDEANIASGKKKVSRNVLLVPQPRNGGADVTGALHAIPICGISKSGSDLLDFIVCVLQSVEVDNST